MNFPIEPQKLTSEWLTDALRHSNAITQATVQSFEVQELQGIQGALSQNVLIHLSYDTPEQDAPRTIFAKFARPISRENLKGFYETEVRFYKQFSKRIELSTPYAYYADIDIETGYFVLLLEYISDAQVGDRATGCSIADAKLIVHEIAKHHAKWWNHPELLEMKWSLTDEAVLTFWQGWYQDRVHTFFEHAGLHFSNELISIVERLGTNLISVIRHFQQSPYTLIHNDLQLDNIFFNRSHTATQLTIIDWQLMSIGRGAMDIASFLGANISVDDRRTSEDSLLQLYHSKLVENGVENYSFDQCWDDYCFGMYDILFRIVGVVGDGANMREEQYIAHRDKIAPRIYAAVNDLKLGEFLT
jgi:thiamine kinase-like enzyme